MSATGFEPVTNGLKGQNPVCASYDQEPANFALSIGHRRKKVPWMLILKVESTRMCQWIFLPLLEMIDKKNCTTKFPVCGLF